MSLKARLRARIAEHGPITVTDYMIACLHDPQDGYYATRPALGEHGDFITAPLVSQIFGELIAVWAVTVWRRMGAPSPFRLVEIGPGDGTLIGDLLRAAKVDPAFLAAMDLWLIERSAPLRALQEKVVAASGTPARWGETIEDAPGEAPLIILANEVLDCLPVRQYVLTREGWAERLVGLDPDGELTFAAGPARVTTNTKGLAVGSVLEAGASHAQFAGVLARRLAKDGGAALLIDYGQTDSEAGDTLQALSRHQKVSPLAEPGTADLTVHARFGSARTGAETEGCGTALATQGEFLVRLGIVERAEALSRAAPDQADKIERQLKRLIDADQMGTLFKALCLYYPPDLSPPGFDHG